MGRCRRCVAVALTAGILAVAGLTAGCALIGNQPYDPWQLVTSGRIDGDRPVKLSLGAYQLGDRVRLAWTLSGPDNPPVALTLRAEGVTRGDGYAHSIPPQKHGLPRHDDHAMGMLDLQPGVYRLYFSQRFRPSRGPGYDISFAIYTMDSGR
jgi:hypothetical protein